MDLARVEHITLLATSLKDAQMDKAVETVAANDADAAKADFTLKDLNNKKVTLSALKGKIVLINFWSTQCIPCKAEMQDLDLIYTHYAQQGLVVLSINGDNPFATSTYLNGKNYHPQVLSDDGKAAKQFHVEETKPEGLPRTFVFNRDGKLVAESIDMCTQRQFFAMLGVAGLKPN
jgi:peroxiredoxin